MTIRKIDLSRLHNGEHFTFHTAFRDMVAAATPARLRIEALFAVFLAVYARLDEALKKITKSEQTARVNELDAQRDRTFRGLVDTVNGYANHFTAAIREAANRVLIVLDTYKNVASMSLDDETAMLYNLCKDLVELRADDVTTLALAPWITELNAVIERADNIASARIGMAKARKEKEEAEKPQPKE